MSEWKQLCERERSNNNNKQTNWKSVKFPKQQQIHPRFCHLSRSMFHQHNHTFSPPIVFSFCQIIFHVYFHVCWWLCCFILQLPTTPYKFNFHFPQKFSFIHNHTHSRDFKVWLLWFVWLYLCPFCAFFIQNFFQWIFPNATFFYPFQYKQRKFTLGSCFRSFPCTKTSKHTHKHINSDSAQKLPFQLHKRVILFPFHLFPSINFPFGFISLWWRFITKARAFSYYFPLNWRYNNIQHELMWDFIESNNNQQQQQHQQHHNHPYLCVISHPLSLLTWIFRDDGCIVLLKFNGVVFCWVVFSQLTLYCLLLTVYVCAKFCILRGLKQQQRNGILFRCK